MGYGYYGQRWKPYVSVAERRRRAEKKLAALRKKGMDVQPIEINGRKIATTFWGAAWCGQLEAFGDYANRLPRGRTYARNGSVCHLAIAKGEVDARVAGSSLYRVQVQVKKLPTAKWKVIKQQSAGKIGSLLELLAGKLSDEVMRIVTDQTEGLLPLSQEISYRCDCPDWAGMCKHIAAVMYGIGARLDVSPELLFVLRGVDHEELIAVDAAAAVSAATKSGKSKRLARSDLSDVFGIEIESGAQATAAVAQPTLKRRKKTAKTAATRNAKKKPTTKRKKAALKKVKKKAVKRKKSVPKKTKRKQATLRKKTSPKKSPPKVKRKAKRKASKKKGK